MKRFGKVIILNLTLFIISCGAYEPANFNSDTVDDVNTAASIVISKPSPTSGDANTVFQVSVSIFNLNDFELLATHISQNGLNADCKKISVENGKSTNPSIFLSGCSGNGSIDISLDLSDVSVKIDIKDETEGGFDVSQDSTVNRMKLSIGNNANTCVIDKNQRGKCWGINRDGDDNVTIVDPDDSGSTVSTRVHGILGTGVGDYYLDDDISGNNAYEIWTNNFINTPQYIDDTNIYADISAGEITSCGVRNDGVITCWGHASFCGDNTWSGSQLKMSPEPINSTKRYISVDTGQYHSCAITNEYEVMCWGDTWGGKLGVGRLSGDPAVMNADEGTKFIQITAGRNHSCGITYDNIVRCWGYNAQGQIGVNTDDSNIYPPTNIDENTKYRFIASGYNNTCAITVEDKLKCWGANSKGSVGIGQISSKVTKPTPVDNEESYSTVSVGENVVCGLTKNGLMKCWGNIDEQIGESEDILTPTQIDSSNSYSAIAVSKSHTCGVRSNGDLYCFGNGPLGDGVSSSSPTPVLSIENFE